MTAEQERRLRELRSRALVRAWDHRQQRHPRGAWFRLRRVLALAKEAYAIPADEAERLVAEGHRPEPVGRELEPPRIILVVSAERVARIVSARPVEARLSAETLAEACASRSCRSRRRRGWRGGAGVQPQSPEPLRDRERIARSTPS